MKIKITADSTCDLSPELLEKYDASIVPLYVSKGGGTYKDGVDIAPPKIFEHYNETGKLCTTSAPNVDDFISCFWKHLKTYDAVIHINLSSEMSSSYQNACIAAKQFTNVYPVDSRNLSSGSGHLVIEAQKMAEQGLPPEEIQKRLNELATKVEASFIIDSLTYLWKGGRCSSVAALGANVLKLKPCIDVINGSMKVSKKYRGSFEHCLDKYVEERLSGREDIVFDRIFITHTTCSKEIVEMVRKKISKCAKFNEIIETDAGCTISCHCGPNTLGILFIRK